MSTVVQPAAGAADRTRASEDPIRPRHVHFALAIAAALIAGCAGYLHDPYRLGDKSPVLDERFHLYFVEAYDEGWFWQADQANRALDAVRRSAAPPKDVE